MRIVCRGKTEFEQANDSVTSVVRQKQTGFYRSGACAAGKTAKTVAGEADVA